ncbi:expressed unknown protein [Seminavis robusta]|uniref:Uncharacterized protein n=1 Tax=Seminavis robusta TaxID=568900 RepID=A0A9N8E9Y9_9STRA|nr:expressed unknown protein [Seminavis robusta]|eukprot:Sro862_g212460.1 n/a (383) ;mRNA; r:23705-24853
MKLSIRFCALQWFISIGLLPLLLVVDGFTPIITPSTSSIHTAVTPLITSSSDRRRSVFLLANTNSDEASTLPERTAIATTITEEQQEQEKLSEFQELQIGWDQIVSLEAFDGTHIDRLWTPEDVIGIAIHIPLVSLAFITATTGQMAPSLFAICAISTLLTSLAHFKMCFDEPRDWKAPRMAEPKSVYEFSAIYLLPFAWLQWRITPLYPSALEQGPFEVLACIALSAITIYGFAYAIYGKYLLAKVNAPHSTYEGPLQPSTPAYQTQAQLYLTGNVVINSLACLFLPFAWTLAIRGTDWWNRVQELHPNQAAFLGISILVATIGDTSGNLLLRLQQLQITTSVRALVVMGILSNVIFLLVPELLFNGIYSSGISEVGFYWE